MRSQEFVTELVSTVGSPEHLINRINKVADICATMGDKPLLYRMLRGTSTGGRYSLIQKVTPRGMRDEKLLPLAYWVCLLYVRLFFYLLPLFIPFSVKNCVTISLFAKASRCLCDQYCYIIAFTWLSG